MRFIPMPGRSVARLGLIAGLALPLLALSLAPAEACRGKGFEEMESSSVVEDFQFPDELNGLRREKMREYTCVRHGRNFGVLYKREDVELAEIKINLYEQKFFALSKAPENTLDIAKYASEFARRELELRSMLNPELRFRLIDSQYLEKQHIYTIHIQLKQPSMNCSNLQHQPKTK
ncbi:hypothetical protein [Microvirga terricola]|uniref:Uncharacterized protein n=1 Tax=Microvirga terricola TaxID=2719797 RepID=A0ABX0VGK3_9HYPH|nr:hypothetical protein [Microvirga terricola]NIX77217.1 hypothetical protein [Microvirga terricola]